MGTRADFYVGRGESAEWLGSIAWDGGWLDSDDEADPGARLLRSGSEAIYRDRLASFLVTRDDATYPADGWPWPWNDSGTTDCAYAFDDGKVWMTWGKYWFDPLIARDDDGEVRPEAKDQTPVKWPDMSERKAVTFGKRSGVMIFGAR